MTMKKSTKKSSKTHDTAPKLTYASLDAAIAKAAQNQSKVTLSIPLGQDHRGLMHDPDVIVAASFVPHGYQIDCHLNGQPLTVQCRDFGDSYEESALAALFIDMATDMVERFRQAVNHGALDNKDASNHFSYPSDTAMLNWLEKQGSAQLGWKVQTPGDYPNVKGCVFACRNTTGGYKTLREAVAARMAVG